MVPWFTWSPPFVQGRPTICKLPSLYTVLILEDRIGSAGILVGVRQNSLGEV